MDMLTPHHEALAEAYEDNAAGFLADASHTLIKIRLYATHIENEIAKGSVTSLAQLMDDSHELATRAAALQSSIARHVQAATMARMHASFGDD